MPLKSSLQLLPHHTSKLSNCLQIHDTDPYNGYTHAFTSRRQPPCYGNQRPNYRPHMTSLHIQMIITWDFNKDVFLKGHVYDDICRAPNSNYIEWSIWHYTHNQWGGGGGFVGKEGIITCLQTCTPNLSQCPQTICKTLLNQNQTQTTN